VQPTSPPSLSQYVADSEDVLRQAPEWVWPALAAIEAGAYEWASQRGETQDVILYALSRQGKDPWLRPFLKTALFRGLVRALDDRSEREWTNLQAGQPPEE
jgi:hypothetical protein